MMNLPEVANRSEIEQMNDLTAFCLRRVIAEILLW